MSAHSPLLVHLILLQGILLSAIIICIFVMRSLVSLKEKKNRLKQTLISKQLICCLQEKTSWDPQQGFRQPFYPLLAALEAFNLRLTGENWTQLKETVAKTHLLPTARKWAKSRSWVKRNAAARAFETAPLPEDEPFILNLIDDPFFLVKSPAVKAAAALESKGGILKIFGHMCLEKGYPHLFYRDVLVEGSSRLFSWIAEIAADTEDLSLKLIGFELLSSRHLSLHPLFLRKAFDSSIPELRLAAIKVYARNPQKESPELLIQAFTDLDEKVRAEAVFGMRYLETAAILAPLTKALTDRSLLVQLQAAASLKHCGEKGIEILNNEKKAAPFGIAQYALEFL